MGLCRLLKIDMNGITTEAVAGEEALGADTITPAAAPDDQERFKPGEFGLFIEFPMK